MINKSNLNYPAIPTDTYRCYNYVYVKCDHKHYKYGAVVQIINLPNHCSGYDIQDDSLEKFHVQEEDIIRMATPKEINHYNKNIKFELSLRYLENSM